MVVYTFSIERAQGVSEPVAAETLDDDETAVHVARHMLDPAHHSVAVGRGEGDRITWLGAWVWNDQQPSWAPED